LDFFGPAGLRPLGIVGAEERNDFSLEGDGDMTGAGVVGDDQVGTCNEGFEGGQI